MATTFLSRNAFADPTLPTFADLIVRVTAAEVLSLRSRQNWSWALRAVARAVGKETVAVPAHPEFLRKLLDQAAPASLGMGRAAWNNARSLTGKALEWACLASMPGHYQAPFTPAWDHLWTKLPVGTALSFQLSRLFHWASAQCVAPADVNDPVLAL
jgi:hypothetical protein